MSEFKKGDEVYEPSDPSSNYWGVKGKVIRINEEKKTITIINDDDEEFELKESEVKPMWRN
ncbi:MAG TPA: hypothetical protein PL042_01745 [Caldisericia bacterium]|nr:hypothetical protein [Caldisericia bacterium]